MSIKTNTPSVRPLFYSYKCFGNFDENKVVSSANKEIDD